MNDVSVRTNSIVAKALHLLSELAAPDGRGNPEWSSAFVSVLAPFLASQPKRSDGLILAHRDGSGPRWHADQLAALCRPQPHEEAPEGRARRRYHARMLGHGLAPDRKEFRPLVTILLPVHNRAGPLVEAVQSCLDQTWRPIEILVIDDGSTDDPQSALLPFGAQVRVIHKQNGGVASARNLGLRLAEGDFIHFLDSDDLLAPAAIENAVAAFAAVPDADLCYGQGQWIDMRTMPPQMKERHFREHANPIRSMIVEFAFTVPTVMIARWRMLAMPPFEEDLRRSSDWRYWQRLGFANAKAIGIRTQTAYLRRFEHSLQTTPHPHDDSHAVAVLRGLRDLVRHPGAWLYAVEYMNLLIGPKLRDWFTAEPSPRIGEVLAELTAALRAGRMPGEQGQLSMLPMLAAMRGRIEQLTRKGHWPCENPACVYEMIAAAVSRTIGGAAPISDRDLAFWTREPDAPLRYHGLQRFLSAIQRRCRPGDAPALADALLRKSRNVPRGRFVRLAARLRPVMGARMSGAVAARWMRWERR